MFNEKKFNSQMLRYAISAVALCTMVFISSCGSDDDGDPPPTIDVDALLGTAVIDFSDPMDLNLVGVTSFETGIGTGYTFDQSDDEALCGVESSYIGAPDLGAIWANGFTVAGWVNFSEDRKFERILDLGKDVGSPDIGQNIGENGSLNVTFSRLGETDSLALTSWIDDDPDLNRSTGRLVAPDVIVNGSTVFYVGTISSTGEMSIYVNGAFVVDKNGHPVANEARTSNFIGRSNWCYFDLDFKGSMSGVWVFNKVLSDEEITALYQDGLSKL